MSWGGVNLSYSFSAVLLDYTYLCRQIGYAGPLGFSAFRTKKIPIQKRMTSISAVRNQHAGALGRMKPELS